jgi:hypothetical protein
MAGTLQSAADGRCSRHGAAAHLINTPILTCSRACKALPTPAQRCTARHCSALPCSPWRPPPPAPPSRSRCSPALPRARSLAQSPAGQAGTAGRQGGPVCSSDGAEGEHGKAAVSLNAFTATGIKQGGGRSQAAGSQCAQPPAHPPTHLDVCGYVWVLQEGRLPHFQGGAKLLGAVGEVIGLEDVIGGAAGRRQKKIERCR